MRIYFEKNQPHYLIWPALAFGKNETEGFWFGLGWLNLEVGLCSKELEI
jgi:hypothetical protein